MKEAVLVFDELPKQRQDDVLKNPEMSPCHLCSMPYEYSGQEIAEKFYNSLCKKDPYKIMLTLKKSNAKDKLNIEDISDDDYKILETIFTEIKNANEDDGIRDMFKKLKKHEFFKHWKTLYKKEEYRDGYTKTMFAEERLQALLECLGYMGILHSERHKGAFFEFYNFGIPPTSSRSSDWNCPVDFWRGKDGIDFEAFDYWFKDYEKMLGIKL